MPEGGIEGVVCTMMASIGSCPTDNTDGSIALILLRRNLKGHMLSSIHHHTHFAIIVHEAIDGDRHVLMNDVKRPITVAETRESPFLLFIKQD